LLLALSAVFATSGVSHFAVRQTFVAMVPTWLPNPAILVAISGVAEVLGALGILWRPTRVAAGWGLIALLIAVFPANVHMLAVARSNGSSAAWQATLWIRLPLQIVLVWCVWWAAIRQEPTVIQKYSSIESP
jgi:uncharacterized membrane protein